MIESSLSSSGSARRRFIKTAAAGLCGCAGLGLTVGCDRKSDERPVQELDRRIEQMAQVPAELLTWQLVKCFRTESRLPVAIAVSRVDGQIYIGADREVQVYAGSRLVKRVSMPVPVRDVAIDPSGRLWVLGERCVIPPSGLVGPWSASADQSCYSGLAVDHELVVVADSGARTLLCMDLSGDLVRRLNGGTVEDFDGFIVPSSYLDVAFSADGQLLATNPGRHTVDRFSRAGRFTGRWGKAGDTPEDFVGCCNPCRVAGLPAGGWLTSEKGIARVKAFNSQGDLTGYVADARLLGRSPTAEMAMQPNAIPCSPAVSPTGGVYVLNPPKQTVSLFQPKGESSTGRSEHG